MPESMEAELVTAFYEEFGAIPAANAQWPRGIRPSQP